MSGRIPHSGRLLAGMIAPFVDKRVANVCEKQEKSAISRRSGYTGNRFSPAGCPFEQLISECRTKIAGRMGSLTPAALWVACLPQRRLA